MKKLALTLAFGIIAVVSSYAACVLYTTRGLPEVLGVYNGCTECTSDVPQGDDGCQGTVTEGGSGKACDLQAVEVKYQIRTKEPYSWLCLWCTSKEAKKTVTVNKASDGTGCYVLNGLETWTIEDQNVVN